MRAALCRDRQVGQRSSRVLQNPARRATYRRRPAAAAWASGPRCRSLCCSTRWSSWAKRWGSPVGQSESRTGRMKVPGEEDQSTQRSALGPGSTPETHTVASCLVAMETALPCTGSGSLRTSCSRRRAGSLRYRLPR